MKLYTVNLYKFLKSVLVYRLLQSCHICTNKSRSYSTDQA